MTCHPVCVFVLLPSLVRNLAPNVRGQARLLLISAAPNFLCSQCHPGTHVEPGSDEDLATLPPDSVQLPSPHDAASLLFPPSGSPMAAPTTTTTGRKRYPPGKRPSQGYIPAQRFHALHESPKSFNDHWFVFLIISNIFISLIVHEGSCRRQLPLEEKNYWEQRAKEGKQQHKIRHLDYRFQPVHHKSKKATAALPLSGSFSRSHSRQVSTSSNCLRKDKPLPLEMEEAWKRLVARASPLFFWKARTWVKTLLAPCVNLTNVAGLRGKLRSKPTRKPTSRFYLAPTLGAPSSTLG